ncbi:terpene synthase family protein [Streptomyces lavendulae]|uniref:terpene synthase family protein n=1 Tax=Streptomyces lavendulae TaxID=1914 RepID=UPI003410CE32
MSTSSWPTDICYATQNRQIAVKKLAEDAQLVIVVGSRNSSNSKRMVEVALGADADAAHLVDFADEIDETWLEGVTTVGLTSGASVPDVLVDGGLEWLAERGYGDVETVKTANEFITFSLPKELRRPPHRGAHTKTVHATRGNTHMTVSFDLPPFYCPLPPPRPHPDEKLLEERALRWLESLGLFTNPANRIRCADTRSHQLMARMTPGAPTELTQLGVDWAYLAFAFDDLRTDTGPSSVDTTSLRLWFEGLDYASNTLDTSSLPDDVFYTAIASLSARIKAATTPALWRRWLADNRTTYWAGVWEAAHRSTGILADFSGFLSVRPHLGLAPSTFTCAEIAAELQVPEHERHDPLVRAVTEAAWLLITIDDDLYSHPKEHWLAQHTGHDPATEPTPIPILMRQHHLTEASATHLLGQIRDRVMTQALRLVERVARGPYSHDTQTMTDMVVNAVRATLDWAQHATRYTNPDGHHPDAIHLNWAGVTDAPVRDTTPLPYPAISWWWDL